MEFVEGDMLDRRLLREKIAGCDAVFHSAAFVSLDPRKSSEIYQCNLESVEAVLGTAYSLGIDNIVYVSSLGALFNPQADVITESSPLGIDKEAYSRSKKDAEALARRLQVIGAPIQITYPSGIFGPDDPKLNESNHGLISLLKVVPQTSSGIQYVDGRDLAQAHLLLLKDVPKENFKECRYVIAGHYLPWNEFHKLLEAVTDRSIAAPTVRGGILRSTGFFMDSIKTIFPFHTSITSESMAIVTQWRYADSSKFQIKYGFRFRPAEETLRDTIRWLLKAGHINSKLAGKITIPGA